MAQSAESVLKKLKKAGTENSKTFLLTADSIYPPFKSEIEGGDDQLKFKIDLTELTTPITLIASMPILKYVHWKEFEPGKVVIFKNGEQIKQLY